LDLCHHAGCHHASFGPALQGSEKVLADIFTNLTAVEYEEWMWMLSQKKKKST
jgi:hypothetical protein